MSDEDPRPADELEFDEPASTPSEREIHPRSRRRPVADWGGDDLFTHVPRRRFTRTGVGAHARRPSESPITTHQLRRNADFGSGASLRGFEHRPALEPGSSSPGGAGPVGRSSIVTIYETDDAAGASATAAPLLRDRPRLRRTVDERVGPRPDRIAALAFALGLLLILLAVSTADAASRAL